MAGLGLGTANFVGPYGIKGDPSPHSDAQRTITTIAYYGGVKYIDRADDYGTNYTTGFRVTWKTRRTPPLHMLQRVPLYAAMLHMPAELRLLDNLNRLKQWGAVSKVGVSAYDYQQLWSVGAESLDIVQVPLNILDARLLPTLRKLHDNGVEVHVRSAFLQGALLMDPDHLPPHFDSVRSRLRDWHSWREGQGLTAVQAALGPLLGLDFVDVVVVGVASPDQMRELLTVKPLPWTDRWAIDDENILEPWRWPKP